MCVKNNAPPVESHCGAAENATDNYTALPKSMPAGRAPGEGELAGRQVTVTLITSLGCRFSPLGCLAVARVCKLAHRPCGLGEASLRCHPLGGWRKEGDQGTTFSRM